MVTKLGCVLESLGELLKVTMPDHTPEQLAQNLSVAGRDQYVCKACQVTPVRSQIRESLVWWFSSLPRARDNHLVSLENTTAQTLPTATLSRGVFVGVDLSISVF